MLCTWYLEYLGLAKCNGLYIRFLDCVEVVTQNSFDKKLTNRKKK